MSQTKKEGAALDLFIMSKCADLLMKVPPSSRRTIVEWLAARVVPILPEPQTEPPAQTSIFEDT